MLFKDRHDAGVQLAAKLQRYQDQPDTAVFGLARGGVVVAKEVANALHLPLDVIVIRKVGAPFNEELAIGAIDEAGEGIFNEEIIRTLGVTPAQIAAEVEYQKDIAHKRSALYRKGRKGWDVGGKNVIVVDDGIATGASMRAALKALRKRKVKKIIMAVPVAAQDSLTVCSKAADETVCLYAPLEFMAVGQFYKIFDQTSDDEVIAMLNA